MKSLRPSKNATDIAVVYMERPKMKNTNIPCKFPFTTSRQATKNEVRKMSGNMNNILNR